MHVGRITREHTLVQRRNTLVVDKQAPAETPGKVVRKLALIKICCRIHVAEDRTARAPDSSAIAHPHVPERRHAAVVQINAAAVAAVRAARAYIDVDKRRVAVRIYVYTAARRAGNVAVRYANVHNRRVAVRIDKYAAARLTRSSSAVH